MLKTIIRQVKTDISAREITKVEAWWDKLSEEQQAALQRLYSTEDEQKEQTISIYLCGKFVEQEPEQKDFWVNHFYDYIVNHELFIDETKPNVGGICSSNKVAETAIRNGIFAHSYECPLKQKNCIIKEILNEQVGKSLQLYIRFAMH
ncbi:MAG: hypothetical protein MRY78_19885 [Saprospiraceae bacterium]|nr:hypothetical protein [Saprospiraceae bacterium]